jgi:cytochrome P450
MIWQGLYAVMGLPRWTPFPGRGRAKRARITIHRELNRIVAARRAQASARRDLLDLLLVARDPETGRMMTDAELANNLLIFMTAGHETSSLALTWTLWLLATHPAAQQRLFEEACAVAGQAPFEARHVEGLAFTAQVIHEALRLYPPVPALTRQASGDSEIGGHRVDARTQIVVPVFAVHRHQRLWDHPERFDPERFTPDRIKARSRYAYLPFGAGPRVCIGSSFAMIEVAVMLATLVRAFRFRTAPGDGPRPIARGMLRPRGGVSLLVELR